MFTKIVSKTKMRRVAILAGVGAGFLMLFCFPQGAATGVSRGLSVCAEVIIPSLFPFLVLTGVFVRSGLAAAIGGKLDGVCRRLFGVSGSGGTAILIGMIGGYPAGAAAIRELLDAGQIDAREAKRLLCFCVNAGPAFLIGTVGAGLLGSVTKGILLYIAHIAASLIIGIACRKSGGESHCKKTPPTRKEAISQAFTRSVEHAAASLISMCGFVVLFAAWLSVSDACGITEAVSSVLAFPFTAISGRAADLSDVYAAFWEVSSGCVAMSASGHGRLLPFLLGMASGWGGLSVYCQIRGMFPQEGIPGKEYFLARLWHGVLGGGVAVLLFQTVPVSVAAVSAAVNAAQIRVGSVSAASSVAMLVMCGAFLFCTADGT